MKWSEVKEPNEECHYHHVVYHCCVFGKVFITWKGWKNSPSYDCLHEGIEVYENSLEIAKEEVENQIRSRLSTALKQIDK